MFSKFAFRILGGVALEYPCPMVAQPARLNASITSRPRRPVAPVTRTVDGILDRDVLYVNNGMTCAYHMYIDKNVRQRRLLLVVLGEGLIS